MFLHTSSPSPIGTKAILLMGGTGTRFGSEIPKQFHRLAGKKVYLHTLEVFLESKLFEEIILVCPKAHLEEVRNDLKTYPPFPFHVIEGGSTRQESSLNGLIACKSANIVVIHDAVRPFVSQEILKANVEGALRHNAVDTCIPSADTLVYAPEKVQIAEIPKRADYLRGQTPQSFKYSLILDAHLKAKQAGIVNSSDDCSLVLQQQHPIHIAIGNEENIKITSELDLFLAEQLLRLKRAPSYQGDESLKGKRFAVTGGTGGIGRALCCLLKKEGAIPIVLSRSTEEYGVDLTSFASAHAAFEKIHQQHGPLDGLINSIGLLKTKHFDQLSSQEIDLLIATNLTGVIYSCKCARLKPRAHIINIASSSYARGRKNFTIYSSAKAAVVNFTQGLAEERPELLINALVPERTNTSMRLENFPAEDPATLLDPEMVAKEIVSLLKQRCLTGMIVEVRKKI